MTFHAAGGELDQLARGFETLDTTLDALRGALRDLNVEDSGPREAAHTFGEALQRLERGLGRVSTQARESALVVRRFAAEESGS